jgi:hypothetical protein
VGKVNDQQARRGAENVVEPDERGAKNVVEPDERGVDARERENGAEWVATVLEPDERVEVNDDEWVARVLERQDARQRVQPPGRESREQALLPDGPTSGFFLLHGARWDP